VVPPEPVQLPEYATFTCAPAGKLHVKVKTAGATVKLPNACVAVCGVASLSVTFTVNDVAPAVLGVPVMAPVDGFKFNPPGSAPTLIEYVYAGVPPAAVQLPVYTTFTRAPAGKLQVNVKMAGATAKLAIARVAVCAGAPLSVTFTVNDVVPAVLGIPVMAPVDGFKFNPAGNAPALIE
jgi:hypothetical protein